MGLVQDVITTFENDPKRSVEAYTLACAFGTSQNTSEALAHIKAYNSRESIIEDGLARRAPQRGHKDRQKLVVPLNQADNIDTSITLPRDPSRVGFKKGETLYFEQNSPLKAHRLYNNQVHSLRHQAVLLDYRKVAKYHIESMFYCPHVGGWCLFNMNQFANVTEDTVVKLWILNQPDSYPSQNALTSSQTQITSNVDGWHESICGSSYTTWVTAFWQGSDKGNPISRDVVQQMSTMMRVFDESGGVKLPLGNNKFVCVEPHSLWKADWPCSSDLLTHTAGHNGKFWTEGSFMWDGDQIQWLPKHELFDLWKVPHVQPDFFETNTHDPDVWKQKGLGPFRALTTIPIYQLGANEAERVRNESDRVLSNIEVINTAGVPMYAMAEYGAINYELNPYHGSVNCVCQTLARIIFKGCVQWKPELDDIRIFTKFVSTNLTYCEDFILQFKSWYWGDHASDYETYKPKKQLQHNRPVYKGFGSFKKQLWDIIYDVLPYYSFNFADTEWSHVQTAAYALVTVGFEEIWYLLNKATYSGTKRNGKFVLDGEDNNTITDLAHTEFDIEEVNNALKDDAVFEQEDITLLSPAQQMSRLELACDKNLFLWMKIFPGSFFVHAS